MRKLAIIGVLVVCALPWGAQAQATTFRMSSPYIEPGKTKAEWQGFYSHDEDDSKDMAWKQNFILGYGVNEYWKTQFRTAYEKGGQGDDPDITASAFENTFALTKRGEHYFDVAIKADYQHFYSGETADNISTKLIVGRNTQDFLHIFNFRITHDIGSDTHNSGGIAWSTRYKYSPEIQPALEIYNDFGSIDKENVFRNQNRSVGPAVSGRISGIDYQAGVLFGLTDSTPDETFKLSIGYQF